jgi:adenine-specific DNA-methyltransferase
VIVTTDEIKPPGQAEDRLPLPSTDVTEALLAQLRDAAPQIFSEGRVDFAKLQAVLGEHIDAGPERYGLAWAGKRNAFRNVQVPSVATLRPQPEESVNWDSTENLIIEGDNLEVLKLLQKPYHAKVKMIYIDPPYNTGNEFIYPDNFREGLDEYLRYTGQLNDDGTATSTNKDTSGRYHSNWLNMMYPRLLLARNLLKEDGVIFVSIDDHEVHNLRLLMDEVFGEENFVGALIWQKSKKGDAKLVAKTHEYVLLFARSIESLVAAGIWRRKKPGANDVLAQYQIFRGQLGVNHEATSASMRAWYATLAKDDPRRAHEHYRWSDERGLYFAADFAGPDDGRDSRPRYDILHPKTGKPCKKPSTGWRWDEKRTNDALAADPPLIHFGADETTIPCRKSYLHLIDSEPYSSVFYRDGRAGTLELESLVGKNALEFPKDVETLKDFIRIVTKPKVVGGDERFEEPNPPMVRETAAKYSVIQAAKQNDEPRDIVLDFFAGSGTTAQSALELNQEDGGNRRFILVQLPEKTDNPQYPTIAHITRERVRRVIAKLQEVGRDSSRQSELVGLKPDLPNHGDLGFRAFKLDSSNFKIWRSDQAPQSAEQLAEQLSLYADNVLAGRGDQDRLYELILKCGMPLSARVESVAIGQRTAFAVSDGNLLICLEPHLDRDTLRALFARKPQTVLCLDTAFDGNDALKTNTVLEAQTHGIIFKTV